MTEVTHDIPVEVIEFIVAQVMNILENDFGIEELGSYGRPTIDDIAARIKSEG